MLPLVSSGPGQFLLSSQRWLGELPACCLLAAAVLASRAFLFILRVIKQIIVSPDASKVVLGGAFTTLNGSSNPGYGLAMVDATTGAALPLPLNALLRNGGTVSSIMSLVATPTGFYGTGYSQSRAKGDVGYRIVAIEDSRPRVDVTRDHMLQGALAQLSGAA